MPTIRIIACPPGEAPLPVREAWIGLELPLPGGRGDRVGNWRSFGVLTAPRGLWRELLQIVLGRFTRRQGYAVNALEAVTLLAQKDPGAARWWREHCAYALTGKRYLIFPADVCMKLPG